MDTVTIIAVAIIAAAALAAGRWLRSSDGQRAGGSWSPPARPGAFGTTRGSIVLDVQVADRDAPAVRRLADSLGHDALAADPELGEVVVTDAGGNELVTVRRPDPLPTITIPDSAPELTPRPAREPSVVERAPVGRRVPMRSDDTPLVEVHKDLVARFDLPEVVLAQLQRRDDGTELVRAILVAAGREATVEHGVVRTGDDAIIVLGDAHGHGLSHDDLSAAFLRYQHSGARRGLAIVLGYVAPTEVRRRQALAPELVYAGPDTIQRMADAAALGADPMRFAVPAAVSR